MRIRFQQYAKIYMFFYFDFNYKQWCKMKNQAKQDKSKIPTARLIFFYGIFFIFQKKLKMKFFKNCVIKGKGETMVTLRLIFF